MLACYMIPRRPPRQSVRSLRSIPLLPVLPLSPLHPSRYALHVYHGVFQPLYYQRFAHSFLLNGGWGCHRLLQNPSRPACQRPLLSLCFQQLPTIKFSNPFVLITMQIAPGVWGVGCDFPISIFEFPIFPYFFPSAFACSAFTAAPIMPN